MHLLNSITQPSPQPFEVKSIPIFISEKNKTTSLSLIFLGLLLSSDLIFILIHITYSIYRFVLGLPDVDHKFLLLDYDKGYPEVFQYIKEFWITGLMIFIGFKTRKPFFHAWAVLFLYFLLDDSLSIHEVLGKIIAIYFGFSSHFNFRANDFGEMLFSAFVFTLLFPIIWHLTYSGPPKLRLISFDLVLLLGLLIFFGVGIDMLHSLTAGMHGSGILSLVEDGGEMVVMSLICWYAFRLAGSFLKGDVVYISPFRFLHIRMGKHYCEFLDLPSMKF